VIRVLIVAPSTVMRSGLEALIASSPGMELVGVYPDLLESESLQPDVVLSTIAPQDVSPPMVLLSPETQPAWTQDLVRLGVRAVVARDASAAGIIAAVEAAASGLATIDPRELETLLGAVTPASAAPVAEPAVLTARELEVLRMLAEGAANKSIAWKLGISEHTVKFHVASILAKLNASTRTEAVTLGIRKGLILI
jgi:NarL family two-component system response regulator YdfI